MCAMTSHHRRHAPSSQSFPVSDPEYHDEVLKWHWTFGCRDADVAGIEDAGLEMADEALAMKETFVRLEKGWPTFRA